MPLDLLRVDERLIHGQVLVGWGLRLGIRYYIVVDEAVARSDWEQELYRSALPDDVTAEFLTVGEGVTRFTELDERSSPGALLTRGTAAMRTLAEHGLLDGRRVNIGGLHGGEGRERVLDYVYLGEEERADLAVISRHAGSVVARDLPTATEVPLNRVLGA